MKYGHVDYNKCVEMKMHFNVYLDGELIDGVVEADDVEGYAVTAVKDEKGWIVVKDGEIEYETLSGSVELVPL